MILTLFLKGYGFLFFVKNMGKNIGANIRKNLSGKYGPGILATCQKPFNHAKQSATGALKTAPKEHFNSRSN